MRAMGRLPPPRKPRKPLEPLEVAEYGRFTPGERKAWMSVGRAACLLLALPEQHPMERHEVCHAIHQLQNYLLARIGLRDGSELL